MNIGGIFFRFKSEREFLFPLLGFDGLVARHNKEEYVADIDRCVCVCVCVGLRVFIYLYIYVYERIYSYIQWRICYEHRWVCVCVCMCRVVSVCVYICI